MSGILVFGIALLGAVVISERARNTVLSTAVLFLVVGFAAGRAGVGLVTPDGEAMSQLAELALFAVLFTDALHLDPGDLRQGWRLPGRALLVGLPLTILVMAFLAWSLTGLGLLAGLLLAAVLAPTDPVLAAAIINRKQVPERLRHLLNVESGLNDGLVLPVVIVLIDLAADTPTQPLSLAVEAFGGLALGASIGVAGSALLGARWIRPTPVYAPLATVAIAVVVFASAHLTGANGFLAAFSAGLTVTALCDRGGRESNTEPDDQLAELLKLAALLAFGALLSPSFIAGFSLGDYAFVAAVILVARPLALAIPMVRSGLTRREWLLAAWFGPKGFASVVYALLVLDAGLASSDHIFHLAGAAVVISIVAHSSTDTVAARWLADRTDAVDHGGAAASSPRSPG